MQTISPPQQKMLKLYFWGNFKVHRISYIDNSINMVTTVKRAYVVTSIKGSLVLSSQFLCPLNQNIVQINLY